MAASENEEVVWLHPQDAERLCEELERLYKVDDRADYAWFALYMFVFVGGYIWFSKF